MERTHHLETNKKSPSGGNRSIKKLVQEILEELRAVPQMMWAEEKRELKVSSDASLSVQNSKASLWIGNQWRL